MNRGLYNLKHPEQRVSFQQAVTLGMGKNRGLFFHNDFTQINNVEALLELDFVTRSTKILQHLISEDVETESLKTLVQNAFNFPIKTQQINPSCQCLELFHGQTLAFKDFGARFMAQCLGLFAKDKAFAESESAETKEITILTATSGDTGAAVAHAFYKIPNIKVKILYPQGKISNLQEKLFCTLGENIQTYAVQGDFDDCQRMVKAAFDDEKIRKSHNLTSANSINVSRLFAQVCYYFEIAAQNRGKNVVVSVPSGNFGNLTAGVIAKRIGAPLKRFIAATNANDTVPRYLINKIWSPKKTVETAANAMDVSDPSNWPRIMHLYENNLDRLKQHISACLHDDEQTFAAMQDLYAQNYIAEPHTAIAYQGLKNSLAKDESGVFIATAHPAKFIETVEQVLSIKIPLPKALQNVREKPNLSTVVSNDSNEFNRHLLE